MSDYRLLGASSFFIASTCKINVYCHRNLGVRLLSAAATLTGRLWVTSTVVAVSFMGLGGSTWRMPEAGPVSDKCYHIKLYKVHVATASVVIITECIERCKYLGSLH